MAFKTGLLLLPALFAFVSSQSSGCIIPLYIYPVYDSNGKHTWQPLVDAKLAYPVVPVWAIVNPDNGPGATQDPNYVIGIQLLRNNSIYVMGYVYTSYAMRNAADVKADVDTWLKLYGSAITGIFFDEMQSQWATTANNSYLMAPVYYCSVSSYAKSKNINFTVGNPGTDTAANGVYVGTVDTIMIYENSGFPSAAQYGGIGGWHTKYPKDKWGIFAHNVSNSAFNATQVNLAKKVVKWIYVTDDKMPNPWDTVSSYMKILLGALKD